MKKKSIRPPEWATRLLSWYCRPDLLEDLEGDLHEYFNRNVKSKGARTARFIYVLDVLKFMRLYTLRKPEFINLIIHWIMIGSYIKTSGRNLVRNRLFSSINIAGLGISMSVGLLMIAMLVDLFSYDRFHQKGDRIYRVISQYQYQGHVENNRFATTSLNAGKAIKETLASVEDAVILRRDDNVDVTNEGKTIPVQGFWANESFFTVFSFNLVEGNPSTALKAPFSVVLAETAARKLFGQTNVLGKTVTKGGREYSITGVMEDVGKFSHIKFEGLTSLSTYEEIEKDNPDLMKWDDIWNTWVYVLIRPGADISTLKKGLDELSANQDKTTQFTHIPLDLQPLSDIMTGENLSNQIGMTMGATPVRIFGILTLIVILSACFNYTNLSIARSFKRTKEIGIRKAIGAIRGQVVSQFIIESITIALLAAIFSFLLFVIVKPHFISLERSLQELLVLDLSPVLIIFFIMFAIVVGMAAGIVPALTFSRITAIQIFKNIAAMPAMKGIAMRRVLIVFQYCISIIAITATIGIYKQYEHFVHYDLGFNTANILNIRLQENNPELLKKKLKELPEVQDISQSSVITSIGNYWMTFLKNPNFPEDSASVCYNVIDENYLPLHKHKLIAGRNFQAKTNAQVETEIIVNERVLKRFNVAGQNPEKAIGETMKVDGKDMMIIGVLKDFEYGKPQDRATKEVIMRYAGTTTRYMNVSVQSKDWPATYAKLEKIWKELDPVHPFEAKFYSEQIEEGYRGMKASMKVGGFLAFLVICIASIGLLGMVIFTTEIRLKEISIRKVLGATEVRLLYLLSRGFLSLIIISALIALPATYLFFDRVLLSNLANHAPVNMGEMIVGTLVVLLIALAMIGSQTLKVARTNPAEVLKNE